MTRVVAMSMLFLCLLAPSANADPSGPPEEGAPTSAGQDTFNIFAHQPGSDGVAGATGGAGTAASSTEYVLEPVCAKDGADDDDFLYGCGGQQLCGDNGELFAVTAHYPSGTSEVVGTQCLEPSAIPAVAVVTPGLALSAFKRVPLPNSEVVIQPPGGETLVNLDTVFSTRAEDFTRTVRMLGHRVELDITASEFRWVSGDGSTMWTDWAGKPWRKGTPITALITHRYEDAQKALRPRVDTTWSARFRVDGGPWREVPGTVTIQGTPYDLAVRSASPYLAG